MAIATGTVNDAAGVDVFCGNGAGTGTLDTAMLAAGWVFLETVPAVTAGTTDVVHVYRDADSTVRLFFEADNTNARLRVRCAERYTIDPTFRLQAHCHGGVAGASITPTATSTVSDTDDTIFGATIATGYINLPFANSAAVTYALSCTARVVYLGLRSGGVNSFFIAGRYTVLANAFASAVEPCFLGGRSGNTSWTTSGVSIRLTRAYGLGAVATPGAFDAMFDYPLPTRLQDVTAPTDLDCFNRINGGTALKGFTNPIVSDAFVWTTSTGTSDIGVGSGRGGLMGYVPDTVVGTVGTEVVGGGADTLNVDGTTYYVFGNSRTTATGGNDLLIAVK